MRRVLVLFAHPVLERSRVNGRLVEAISDLEGVTVHDLYEEYPTLAIDVAREQELLLEHDVDRVPAPVLLVLVPAILKEWQDLVLEHGWAYGHGGTQLRGKITLNAITTGGPAAAYAARAATTASPCASCSRRGSRPRTCAACASSRRSWSTRALQVASDDGRRGAAATRLPRACSRRCATTGSTSMRAAAAENLADRARSACSARAGGRHERQHPRAGVRLPAAAVVFVPIAKRLGLGAVLGYLIAGVVIGPYVLGLVGGEGHDVDALRRVRRRDDAVPRRARAAARRCCGSCAGRSSASAALQVVVTRGRSSRRGALALGVALEARARGRPDRSRCRRRRSCWRRWPSEAS